MSRYDLSIFVFVRHNPLPTAEQFPDSMLLFLFFHKAKRQVDEKPMNSNCTAICQHQGLYGQMFNSAGSVSICVIEIY